MVGTAPVAPPKATRAAPAAPIVTATMGAAASVARPGATPRGRRRAWAAPQHRGHDEPGAEEHLEDVGTLNATARTPVAPWVGSPVLTQRRGHVRPADQRRGHGGATAASCTSKCSASGATRRMCHHRGPHETGRAHHRGIPGLRRRRRPPDRRPGPRGRGDDAEPGPRRAGRRGRLEDRIHVARLDVTVPAEVAAWSPPRWRATAASTCWSTTPATACTGRPSSAPRTSSGASSTPTRSGPGG